jgi:hypothetical protein
MWQAACRVASVTGARYEDLKTLSGAATDLAETLNHLVQRLAVLGRSAIALPVGEPAREQVSGDRKVAIQGLKFSVGLSQATSCSVTSSGVPVARIFSATLLFDTIFLNGFKSRAAHCPASRTPSGGGTTAMDAPPGGSVTAWTLCAGGKFTM